MMVRVVNRMHEAGRSWGEAGESSGLRAETLTRLNHRDRLAAKEDIVQISKL